MHSNARTSAGSPPKKETAFRLSAVPTAAGGAPTMAQTVRNAVLGTTVSEATKVALSPVLGTVAQTALLAGQLSTPIGIVGLALGAGGLALGAYGVYSVRRLRGTVRKLQADMESGGEELARLQKGMQLQEAEMNRGSEELAKLQTVVQMQWAEMERGFQELSRLQEVVQRGCQQLACCITDMSARLSSDVARGKDEIIEVMREGFQGLHIRLEAMEERDLQEKIESLVQQYSLCFSVLASGKSNSEMDCKDLEDDAKAALAKITRAMKAIPPGHAGRLPLLAMHTFATRARIDARDMRVKCETSSEDPFREGLLRQAMALVKEEVEALLASRSLTLYTVGVVLARPLAQYRLLHQGLALALHGSTSEQHLVVRVDGQLVPPMGSENVVWEDGLDTIRDVFAEEREGHNAIEALKVATLSDLLWYKEWKHLGLDTLVSQIPSQVSVQQVLTELGVPVGRKWGLDMDSMEKLKELVLPSFRCRVEGLLTKELESLGAEVRIAVGDSAGMQWKGVKRAVRIRS
eukprot:TRINITY_DN7067_c0_g1_i1.p1 TRINITY_DN7067_c0_g1~~TRINITY_DN7067_c0_g1_i1.p1  ORF type:complete len:521 (+),score=107.24 TRINITY_DN7067_c0_g1_i1:277-1839(+)